MRCENFVFNDRHLTAILTIASDGDGARAVLITVEEHGIEVARIKLIAPLPIAALKWLNHTHTELLHVGWNQFARPQFIQMALASSEKPLVVALE